MHWPERADWPGIEIGWAFNPRAWGKGYATEAGAASVDYAFAHHDVDALYSVILPENERSQAVARRLGFELFELRITSHFPEFTARHLAFASPRDLTALRPELCAFRRVFRSQTREVRVRPLDLAAGGDVQVIRD